MNLQEICNWIILIGSVTIAIVNILKFFGKPISFMKKKKEEEFQENFKKQFDEIMPDYMLQHDLDTRDKYRSDRERYLQDIKNAVLGDTKNILERIEQLTVEQSEALKTLQQGTLDMLRQKIMTIYYDYKDIRKLPIHKKEALDELYKDYKIEHGNSYIDKYYGRMKAWEIDYSDDEED